MNNFLQSKQPEFIKTIDFFKKEIATLRTGRANPMVLDGIFAEVYGMKTLLKGLASITVADGRSIVVAPWDKNSLKDIEKAIVEADLGFGVVNEGGQLRLTVPPMTEENRKDLVKKLNEKMEESRIAIRQTRDEVKKAIEEAEEKKEMNEDDKFRFIKELDEEVTKRNEEIKVLREKKEAEIMTV